MQCSLLPSEHKVKCHITGAFVLAGSAAASQLLILAEPGTEKLVAKELNRQKAASALQPCELKHQGVVSQLIQMDCR